MLSPPVVVAFAESAALAVAFLLFAAALGFALLPTRTGRKAVLAVPLGLSTGSLAAGLATWIWGVLLGTGSLPVLWGLLAVVALRRTRHFAVALRRTGHRLRLLALASPLVSLATAAAFLPLTLPLLTPLSDSDGLRYHVALPKLFLLQGRISWYPWDVLTGLPQTAEMFFLAAVAAGRPEAAKFLHVGFLLATALTIGLAVHGSKRTRTAAPLVALFLASSPVFLAAAGAGFIDHVASFHVATTMLLLARPGDRRRASLSLAAAFATKVTAGPAVAALATAAALSEPRGRRLRFLVTAAGALALAFLPFAARNVAETRDPFFPVGYGILGIPIPGVSPAGLDWVTRFAGDSGLFHVQFLPGAGRADEVLGPHLLAALVLAVAGWRERRLRPLLAPLLASVPLWLVFAPTARFLIPSLLGLAGLAAAGLCLLAGRRAGLIGVVLAIPGALAGASLVASHQHPLDLVLGRVSREEWLNREVPGHRAARTIPPGNDGAVMALDFPAPFYFDRPWVAEGVVNTPPLKSWLAEQAEPADLLQRTRALGVRWILVTPGYGGGTPLSLLALSSPEDVRGVRALLDFRSRLRLAATVDGIDVWEVPP